MAALLDAGLVDPKHAPQLAQAEQTLRIGVSAALRPALRPDGPVARQLLPSPQELALSPEERADPIGDAAHSPVPGVVHRYPSRALLMPTQLCAVYCRFCFRREQVGEGGLDRSGLDRALDYLRDTPALREVILTGGDPLVLAPGRLGPLLAELSAIPHLRHLRIHTRVPLVAPERITPELVSLLRAGLPLTVALHTNHSEEFTEAGREAIARLVDGGVPMASQTVLLRGVNDSVEALEALMWTLLEARVRPYYLHQLDRARGTEHFRVPIAEGLALMEALRPRLPGLALPRYVLDIPGGHGKVPIDGAHVRAVEGGYLVTDPWGGEHAYAEAEFC